MKTGKRESMNSEQLAVNSEQLAVNSEKQCSMIKHDENKHSIRTAKLLTAHCSLLTSHFSLFTIFLLLILLTIAMPSSLSALDFNFRPKGFVSIPMGEANKFEGNKIYSTGGGGEIGFEADISSVLPNPLGIGYTLGIEGGMLFNPMQTDNAENVSFYSIGGVAGLYFFPLSRLFTRIDGAAGVSVSSRAEVKSNPGLYWRYGGEIGFRFTTGFTLAANAGWRQFHSDGAGASKESILNSGMYAGLTAQITFQTGSANLREGVRVQLDQDEPMYPLLIQLYQNVPAANIILRNNENAEIRNVRVYFRARGYTASEFLCDTIGVIPRGRTVEVPLLSDFSPEILRFTDTGRIMGEVVIRYRFLGREREAVRAVTVATHNRNTVPLGDTNAFAAFVSPTSVEVLDFARFIAGLERTNRRSGINTNYQYAVWLLEGIRASGIKLGNTYTDGGLQSVTHAQYPAETLSFTTGNSRDLALLFAACIEATGKRAALIQVTGNREQGRESGERASGLVADNNGDFLVAVSLGTVQEAGALAANRDRVLIVNDEVWLPLSMSGFNNGFTAAWTQGYTILNRAFAAKQQADFVVVQDAWAAYPSAPLPELGVSRIRTDTNTATNRALGIIGR